MNKPMDNIIYDMLSEDEQILYKLKGEELWLKELQQEIQLREMKRQFERQARWNKQ